MTAEGGSSVNLAPAGEDGVGGSHDGANGFSGGGGEDKPSSGGSDGGDGEAGSEGQGGKGSGLDISSLVVINFVLTYGSGGYQQCGGVLINGQGPDRQSGRGEGFG